MTAVEPVYQLPAALGATRRNHNTMNKPFFVPLADFRYIDSQESGNLLLWYAGMIDDDILGGMNQTQFLLNTQNTFPILIQAVVCMATYTISKIKCWPFHGFIPHVHNSKTRQ